MQKIRTSFTKIAVYIILFMAVQPSFIAESFVYDESKSLLGLTHEEQLKPYQWKAPHPSNLETTREK